MQATNANAGAYDTINETTNPSADWSQWTNVPYYTFPKGVSQSGSGMTDLRDVYISNDANNIYVRVDNDSGALSAFNTDTQVRVAGLRSGLQPRLRHVEIDRRIRPRAGPSDELPGRQVERQQHLHQVQRGSSGWTSTGSISSIAPQWDTATGRIEAEIPISALTSTGSAATGSFAYLDVELAYQNPSTGAWQDDDLGAIHYQLTGSGTAWLYGNTAR